jgi:hypothetical protein
MGSNIEHLNERRQGDRLSAVGNAVPHPPVVTVYGIAALVALATWFITSAFSWRPSAACSRLPVDGRYGLTRFCLHQTTARRRPARRWSRPPSTDRNVGTDLS